MPSKKFSGKAVWAVSVAVILVVILLIALFLSQAPSSQQESITLPPEQEMPQIDISAESEKPLPEDEHAFFEVTNDNVLMALQSLSRPMAYHQAYNLTVGSDDVQAFRAVELWVNGSLIRGEVSSENETRILITDGSTAYLWYENGETVISVEMDDSVSIEDLLGLPDFDSHLTIKPETVVDSGYLVMEETQIQCIYVSTQSQSGETARYWVNLESGLLYQSDMLEDSTQVYTLRQTMFETLALEDESFADCFVLPDGTSPFTVGTKTLQP